MCCPEHRHLNYTEVKLPFMITLNPQLELQSLWAAPHDARQWTLGLPKSNTLSSEPSLQTLGFDTVKSADHCCWQFYGDLFMQDFVIWNADKLEHIPLSTMFSHIYTHYIFRDLLNIDNLSLLWKDMWFFQCHNFCLKFKIFSLIQILWLLEIFTLLNFEDMSTKY